MKIVIVYNTAEYLVRFRSELIRKIVDRGHEVVLLTPLGPGVEQIAETGGRWRRWNMDGQGLNAWADLVAFYEIYKILADERPESVLLFTVKPVLYGSLACGFLNIKNTVSMITGMGSLFIAETLKRRVIRSLVRQFYKISLRRNDHVIFQNSDDIEYFVDALDLPRRKALKINGSGVNLDIFSPDRQEVVTPRSFLLISRMIKQKGVREYVKAARLVKESYPDARFTLMGPIDNSPDAICESEIRGWHDEGIIIYVGEQSDVKPFMARTEVYVLPTYYMEGVPRSILEALSMGKPVITSDWRGCRDTVEEGINGFLVPTENAQALAEAMMKFILEPDLSLRFGKESRRLAEAEFDVEQANATVIKAVLGSQFSALNKEQDSED